MRDAQPDPAGMPPITLDRNSETPLPAQLVAALRVAIDADVHQPGERLPATRAFAERLGVSRGSIVTAYEQLIAEGYLAAGHGRGTVVNPDLSRLRGAARQRALGNTPVTPPAAEARVRRAPHNSIRPGPLTPGAPLSDTIDRPAWRAAWRDAAARAHETPPALGDGALRQEIAEHLRRMRGTHRSPDDVIVTAGAREGLGLLLTALGTTRGRVLAVGVEDPGYPSLRAVAARHGARVVGLETDADGLVPGRLPQGMLDLIIVTPSHQHPVGSALSLARRRELISWARRSGVVLVEDDYDSELRYAGSPLPALAALDDPKNAVVATLGSFSTTVTPALAAGYILAPAGLRAYIEPVRIELGGPVSVMVQAALANLLGSGEIRRHTARMRRRYASRRARVTALFSDLPGVRVQPMHGGLHAVIELDDVAFAADERLELGTRLAGCVNAGLGAVDLHEYWQRRDDEGIPSGLVIGLGGSDEGAFRRAIAELALRFAG